VQQQANRKGGIVTANYEITSGALSYSLHQGPELKAFEARIQVERLQSPLHGRKGSNLFMACILPDDCARATRPRPRTTPHEALRIASASACAPI
jgi:hypothetical protein